MVNCVTKIKIVHFQAFPEFVIYGQKMKLWPTVMTTGNGKLKIANLSAAKVSHTTTENVETLGNDHKWKLFSLIFTMLCCPLEWLVMTENQVQLLSWTCAPPSQRRRCVGWSLSRTAKFHFSKSRYALIKGLFMTTVQCVNYGIIFVENLVFCFDQKLRENKLVTAWIAWMTFSFDEIFREINKTWFSRLCDFGSSI